MVVHSPGYHSYLCSSAFMVLSKVEASLVFWLHFSFFFFFERERESVCSTHKPEGQKERKNPKQTALSAESDVGLELTTLRL